VWSGGGVMILRTRSNNLQDSEVDDCCVVLFRELWQGVWGFGQPRLGGQGGLHIVLFCIEIERRRGD